MKQALWAVAMLSLCFAAGCGKTWVEDEGNFQRTFGIEKPPSVQVVHSYYREETNLLGTKHNYYFIAFRSLDRKIDLARDFADPETTKFEVPDARARYGCGRNPPGWFVSKSPEHYDMWVLKAWPGTRVFRDKDDSTIYSCGGPGSS